MLLREKIDELRQYMIKIGYSKNYLQRLNIVWLEFCDCFEKKKDQGLSFESQNQFLLKRYGASLDGKPRPTQIIQYQAFRAINLLNEFIKHGAISLRYERRKQALPEEFENSLPVFENYSYKVLNHRKSTFASNLRWVKRFLQYAESKNVTRLCDLTGNLFLDYLQTLPDLSSKTRLLYFNAVKYFDDCLFVNKITVSRFMADIKINHKKEVKYLPTWSKNEIRQLLASLDRSNPIELRDYAMILIAAVLGLRLSDIISLRFKDIDFKNKKISIIQHKTRIPLELPLPNEVGWAIIDYLKNGRPKSSSSYIFLRHSCPIAPFSVESCNNFHCRISKYLNRAGIKRKRGVGFHSFRHALATNLVLAGVDLGTISNILGHCSSTSTDKYISLDENNLRLCPIDIDAIMANHDKEN